MFKDRRLRVGTRRPNVGRSSAHREGSVRQTNRSGHLLAPVCIASILTLFASPAALAGDGVAATLTSTSGDPTSVISGTPLDEVTDTTLDTVDATIDTAADTTSGAVDTVDATIDTAADTASGAVDTVDATVGAVSGTTSGAVGTITDATSDAGGSVADQPASLPSAVDGTIGAVADAVTADGSASNGPTDSVGSSADVTSRLGGTTSSSRSRVDAAPGTAVAMGRVDPGSAVIHADDCPAPTNRRCSSGSGTDDEDSLVDKIAEIIGLLALTGFHLLPWIAAAIVLSIGGWLALERCGAGTRSPGSTPA
jgi:hypothetical protein